jgi:ketosteroid isomerase-like protein
VNQQEIGMKLQASHAARVLTVVAVIAVTSSLAGTVDEPHQAKLPSAVTDWSAAEAAITETVQAYYTALSRGDIQALESFVLDDERFVMLEGRHSNWSWPDYRDHHLAGELEDLSKVRFRLSFYRVAVGGTLGYATFAYEVLPKEGPEMDFGRGFATAVLERTDDGWKLRHLHTS